MATACEKRVIRLFQTDCLMRSVIMTNKDTHERAARYLAGRRRDS